MPLTRKTRKCVVRSVGTSQNRRHIHGIFKARMLIPFQNAKSVSRNITRESNRMTCPEYYRLADGLEFDQFYDDECRPLVQNKLADGQKHSLQSACEHLFRRGLKSDEASDLTKYRWWLSRCLTAYRLDREVDKHEDHVEKITRYIVPVLALVEFRRNQKLRNWKNLLSAVSNEHSKQEQIPTLWGSVESLHVES